MTLERQRFSLFVDLGDGWDAAVFESEQEFEFVEENLRPNQDQEYFVNGSSLLEGFVLRFGFDFTGYSLRQTGKKLTFPKQ